MHRMNAFSDSTGSSQLVYDSWVLSCTKNALPLIDAM